MSEPARRTRYSATSEAEAIDRVTHRLRQQFPELPAETVETSVHEHHQVFDGRPVRDFIPILVERATRTELRTGHRIKA
jgi:hypothetical protein